MLNQEMIEFIEKYGEENCKVALEEYEKIKNTPIPIRSYIINKKLYVSARDLFYGLNKSPSREIKKVGDKQKTQLNVAQGHRKMNLIDVNYLIENILK